MHFPPHHGTFCLHQKQNGYPVLTDESSRADQMVPKSCKMLWEVQLNSRGNMRVLYLVWYSQIAQNQWPWEVNPPLETWKGNSEQSKILISLWPLLCGVHTVQIMNSYMLIFLSLARLHCIIHNLPINISMHVVREHTSGFMSRWTTPLRWHRTTTFSICLTILAASFSLYRMSFLLCTTAMPQH